MESTLLILILFIFFSPPVRPFTPCNPVQCDPLSGPEVRFPFQLKNRQRSDCGYPGFHLSCDADNRTLIKFPRSGEFVVNRIEYITQSIFIKAPIRSDRCIRDRILNFSMSVSRYHPSRNYTFWNCSSEHEFSTSNRSEPVMCTRGGAYAVVMTTTNSRSSARNIPEACRRIASVLAPLEWTVPGFYWMGMEMGDDLQLLWDRPSCLSCEGTGQVCGLADSGHGIACYDPPSKPGLSTSAKYGIILGLGIPSLICIIGLICYMGRIFQTCNLEVQLDPNLSTSVFDQRLTNTSTTGLDQPTIESYPTIVLGESGWLPNPSDFTCPICLSDYEPKEILRSIPECDHYFHAECVDGWLKSNGTCPLCRKLPKSSIETPCFITSEPSLASSSSPSTTTLDRD